MREWLSGGAPPCQGGGRGFDPRLALERRTIPNGIVFLRLYNRLESSISTLLPDSRRSRSHGSHAPSHAFLTLDYSRVFLFHVASRYFPIIYSLCKWEVMSHAKSKQKQRSGRLLTNRCLYFCRDAANTLLCFASVAAWAQTTGAC